MKANKISTATELMIVISVAVLVLVVIQLLTNSLDTKTYSWDFAYYLDMAQNGIIGNPNNVAPFAYRWAYIALIQLLIASGLSAPTAFLVWAWIGVIFQLVTAYYLSRFFSRSRTLSLLNLLLVGFCLFNIKFLLFDPYRPDVVALGLIALSVLLLFQGRYIPVLIISITGLQFREFLLVPGILIVIMMLREYFHSKENDKLLIAATSAVAIIIGFVSPRILINVRKSLAAVPLDFSFATVKEIIYIPLNWKRDINLVFCCAGLFLPSLLLFTRVRWSAFQIAIARDKWIVIGYTLLILLLAMYGGTDLPRFVSYLFVVQVVFIAAIPLRPHWWEILLVTGFTFLFNRIPFQIPIWDIEQYTFFYGGFNDMLSLSTLWRSLELLSYVIILMGMRFIVGSKTS